MPLIPLSETETELLSLDEIKIHLRMDSDEQDSLLAHLLTTARMFVEQYTGLSLVKQTWKYVLDRFPTEKVFLTLPHPPLQSVTSFSYIDTKGETQYLIEGTDFVVDHFSQPARIAPLFLWPETGRPFNAVTLEYISGWDEVPAPMKHAMLLLIGHWFEHRESVTNGMFQELPMSIDSLLIPYRVWRFV
jgi:uncharacterized phiE125 gp8 family phage protein